MATLDMNLADIRDMVKKEKAKQTADKPKKRRGRPRKKKPVEPEPEPPADEQETEVIEFDTGDAQPQHNIIGGIQSRLSNFLNSGFRPPADEEEAELYEEVIQEETELERQKLVSQLTQLALSNPRILDLKGNDVIRRINRMSVDELETKLLVAKQSIANNMNGSLSNLALSLLNNAVGRSLNCIDELNNEVREDKELQDTVKQFLGCNILTKLPPQVKLLALYGADVMSALDKKKRLESK